MCSHVVHSWWWLTEVNETSAPQILLLQLHPLRIQSLKHNLWHVSYILTHTDALFMPGACVVFMNMFNYLYRHIASQWCSGNKRITPSHWLTVQWCYHTFLSSRSLSLSIRPALGGLLSSSYRQHQESLAAERERRRVEREERLQRIEREERNKHRWGIAGFFYFSQ